MKELDLCDTIKLIKLEKEIMTVSYRPLWIQLANKGLQKTDVIKKVILTTNVMPQMKKSQTISFKKLEKICTALECSSNDCFEFTGKESGNYNETDNKI